MQHYQIKGLTTPEVEKSRLAHGSNALSLIKSNSFWRKYFASLKDPIIIILLIALGINIILIFLNYAEWFEGVGIATAVLVATFVTTFSEHKKEAAFQKLQEVSSKVSSKVIRNGLIQLLPINDLVVGDYVVLQPGDLVPADARMVMGDLAVVQATITGEPESVTKRPSLKKDVLHEKLELTDSGLVFRGTIVSEGEAAVEIFAVGDKTIYGKIFSELTGKERLSPLQVRLSKLAAGISKFGYFGGMAIFMSFLFKKIFLDNAFSLILIADYFSNWQVFLHDLVTAVILTTIIIVVAVPEGLPMMIALVLSLNMRKMLRDNVLVRKLIGIETAGSLNLLYTDKTGTITEGRLEAVLFVSGDGAESEQVSQIPNELKDLLTLGIRLSSSCFVKINESGEEQIIGGNLTDRALVNFVRVVQLEVEERFEVVRRIPFGSEKKFSAVQLNDKLGPYSMTFIKGAPEQILQKCDHTYDYYGNKKRLSEQSLLIEKINQLSDRAMRIIAVAASDDPLAESDIPHSLTLIGFIAIRDQIRDNLARVIEETARAGIQIVMLTGDKRKTAVAIARECGIMENSEGLVISSLELTKLSDQDLTRLLPKLRVIDRALPEDKSRLVRVAQNAGLVAGMTGDGVNDASALQNADVGFALGSGTEAAKEAGDIVILDDNISSVSKAVLYGRTIFNSIRKFIVFQFTVNLSVIITAFIGPFIGFDMPLTMVQLLWINLVMDTLAALAYGGEPPLKEFMLEKPKRRDEPIINGEMWSSIIFNSLVVVIIGLIYLTAIPVRAFFQSEAAFMTGFFAFFVFIHNFNKFNTRTERMNLFYHILDNKGFLLVFILIFAIQIIFTYWGGEIMRTVGLSLREWLFVFALSAVIIPLDLFRKLVREMIHKYYNEKDFKLSVLRARV